LQGVSVNASGGVGLSAGNGVGSGGGITTQLGPGYSFPGSNHPGRRQFRTYHFPAEQLVLTHSVLVDTTRTYEAQYVQNFDFGLSAQLTYMSTRVGINSAILQPESLHLRRPRFDFDAKPVARIRTGGQRPEHPRAEE
jgi:hypothetical protein